MSFPHWLPWSSNQIQIGFSTLDKLFSCQYVSKLKQRLFYFLVAGECATVQLKDVLIKIHPIFFCCLVIWLLATRNVTGVFLVKSF